MIRYMFYLEGGSSFAHDFDNPIDLNEAPVSNAFIGKDVFVRCDKVVAIVKMFEEVER